MNRATIAVVLGTIVLAGVVLATPGYLLGRGAHPDAVAAYGQWAGDAIVAIAAIFAIYQLVLSKRSSETDAFLRICDMIDEKEFLRNYDLVLKHRARLVSEDIAENGLDALTESSDYTGLEEAALDVLYQLEKIGILMHHAIVNKRMVTDYIGEVVINSYDALFQLISWYQGDDRTMYERLVELRHLCLSHGWPEEMAARMKPTGITQ